MAAMIWTRGSVTRMGLLSLIRGLTQHYALQAEIMSVAVIQMTPNNSKMDVRCLIDDGPSSIRMMVLARTLWRCYGGASAATGHSTSISYTPLSSSRILQQQERHLPNLHLHPLHLTHLLLRKIIADPPSSPSSRPLPTPARA
jgi:hypothetical protein